MRNNHVPARVVLVYGVKQLIVLTIFSKNMIVSSSLESTQIENTERLGVLYTKHHDWLIASAYNQAQDLQTAQDLVQELYLYLGEKNNKKLYYNDSFNLLYCHNFIRTRFINYIKRQNKNVYPSQWKDTPNEEYDIESDLRLDFAYDKLKEELKNLQQTKMWSSAKLFELYYFADITMDELSKKIGISKSTTFLNIKKIREHLKQLIDNPFK